MFLHSSDPAEQRLATAPITGAIFDCDGTLIDSLDAWRGLEGALARMAKVEVAPEERARFTTFTLPEIAAYFHEVYGLAASNDAVMGLIDDYMLDFYRNRAQALPGVVPFLEACAREGIAMSVASSSAPEYLEAGLASAGINTFFDTVLSVNQVGASKRDPRIFVEAIRRMGTKVATTWGFEDSLYAMSTLRGAGFPVVGVYDPGEGVTFEELCGYTSLSIHAFSDLSLVARVEG